MILLFQSDISGTLIFLCRAFTGLAPDRDPAPARPFVAAGMPCATGQPPPHAGSFPRRRERPEAHQRRPDLADPARRAAARAELDAHVAGHHPEELRKSPGRTQAEVAAALGVGQSRIAQIENGDPEAMESGTLRACAAALGGGVGVTISAGARPVKVA
jgi:DNA-binding XRE family transcriptional regulator